MNSQQRLFRFRSLTTALVVLLLTACAVPAVPAAGPAAPAAQTAGTAGEAVSAPAQNLTDGCVETYRAGVDYFPEKVTVEYAEGFEVEYHDNYKVVTVTDPWQGAEEQFRYVLVQCGTPAPEGYEEAAVIEVPVEDVIALSTTYLPHLESLGLVDRLVGLDSLLWTTSEPIRERSDAGEIAEVGSGANVNMELVLDLDPDLVMAYGMGDPQYDTHPVLQEAGVPVVLNGDFVEQDPLGRTEWMKFLALFFNKEGDASDLIDAVAEEYQEVAALAANAEEEPTVLVGSVFNGTWHVSGGNSYTARLIEDAGADYLWSDEGDIGSIPLDFESVLAQAADADYWINPDNSFWFSVEDVLASDERYGDFAAVEAGRLYNNNAIVNESGGNAFYEAGAANPHIVLKDLVKIFHPDLLPDHELTFYRQIQ